MLRPPPGNASPRQCLPRKGSHNVDGPYHRFVMLSQHTEAYSGSNNTVSINVAVGGPYHPPFCGDKGLARASLRALPGLWPAHTFPGTGHVVLACCLIECSSTMCHNTCKCVSLILKKKQINSNKDQKNK